MRVRKNNPDGRTAGPHRGRRVLQRLLFPALILATGVALVGVAPPAGAAPAVPQLTLEQQVGQLFMVGAPATGAGAATISAIRDRHVGNVILTGRSSAGVTATAGVTGSLRALATPAATGGVGLLIATDQEGGQVQVLSGPGFSAIPSGLSQGGLAPGTLRADAGVWGGQLRAAGVDADLAPVLDTVPSPAAAATNPPIGVFDREYGFTPATVAAHGLAFAQGMADAGVVATGKHFPGLGRVTANTDTQSGVTDTVTTRNDPYLAPFAQAARSGVPMIMMSTAIYSRIDPAHPAAFSSTVIRGMLRGDLGFNGVVVSDDLGQARQVAAFSPGDRALQFLQAGGDLVLTVDPNQLPAMYDAVLARAQSDPGFRAVVQQAATRVLALKHVPTDISPVGVAAVRTSAGAVTAFVRGTDGAVWQTSAAGGAFPPLSRIESTIVGGPAAVSPFAGRIDLFAVGPDRALWHAYTSTDAQGRPTAFSPWENLGGFLTTSPAVASAGGRLEISARGAEGALWSIAWTGSAWSPWQPDGGVAISAPAVEVAGGGYRVLVVGADGAVWNRQLSAAGVPVSDWSPTGTTSATAPAVSATSADALAPGVLAVGSGSGLRQVWPGGRVVDLGGIVTSAPAVAGVAATSAWTFARGADQALWVDVVTGSGASSAWSRIGGVLG